MRSVTRTGGGTGESSLESLRRELHGHAAHLRSLIDDCLVVQLGQARRGAGSGHPRAHATTAVSLGEVEVQPTRQAVHWDSQSRRLTPTEWQLLLFFLANPDQAHPREEVAAGAWGDAYQSRHSEVEVYVSRLRRKLGPAAARLETVRGRGYRLVMPAGGGAEVVVASVPLPLAELQRLHACMEEVLGSVRAAATALDNALTDVDTIA